MRSLGREGFLDERCRPTYESRHSACSFQISATDRFYEPIKTYTGGQLTYSASVRSLQIGHAGQGGTEGTKGINPVVNGALQELKQLKSVVSTSRDRLGAALGFGRTTSGKDQ